MRGVDLICMDKDCFMASEKLRLLLVDDEIVNLELLRGLLEDAEYEVESVDSGEAAWEILQNRGSMFSAVLLDRSMPDIDGLEVLKRAKKDPDLRSLPIVMQTGKTQSDDILAGLEAGAHYYITKPFDAQYLLAVVHSAIETYQWHKSLQKHLDESTNLLNFLKRGTFKFRTLQEGEQVVSLLSKSCPEAEGLILGLSELMVNAVEHGNLGISYDEKSQLIENNTLQDEIIRRQALPNNEDKYVTLSFERGVEQLVFEVEDCGEGFDWESYLEIDPKRAFDTHGRGIAMAKAASFDELKYENNGAKVRAVVNVKV